MSAWTSPNWSTLKARRRARPVLRAASEQLLLGVGEQRQRREQEQHEQQRDQPLPGGAGSRRRRAEHRVALAAERRSTSPSRGPGRGAAWSTATMTPASTNGTGQTCRQRMPPTISATEQPPVGAARVADAADQPDAHEPEHDDGEHVGERGPIHAVFATLASVRARRRTYGRLAAGDGRPFVGWRRRRDLTTHGGV